MNLKKSVANLNKFERCLWGGSVLAVLMSFLLAGNHDWLSLTASLIGVTSLIFIAKGDVLGQVLVIIFSLIYGIISFKFTYYGEMITYVFMTMPIAIASVVTWLRNPYSECEVEVSRLKKKHVIVLLILTLLVTWIFYYILAFFNTANLIPSTISVATSFLAASLMLLRSQYYAVAYGANDLVLIVLWVLASFEDPAYLTMVMCFATFFINDMYGFINWNRMKNLQAE